MVRPETLGGKLADLWIFFPYAISRWFFFNSPTPFFAPRNDSTNKGRSADAAPLPATNKIEGSTALVKAGPEKVKTTPAGEYLTAALNDFDSDKYDGLATISDGANKLLMLVCIVYIHFWNTPSGCILCHNELITSR